MTDGEDEGLRTSPVLPATADSSQPAGLPGRVTQHSLLIRVTFHPLAPGRGDALDGGGRQEHPSPARDPPGTSPARQTRSVPRLRRVLGRNSWPDGFVCLECSKEERWLLWAAGDRRESVTPRRQPGLSRCQSAAPQGSRAMGKGKLALDKALSATTGPMGSRPGPLSQPLCPRHTHRALPTCPHPGVPLRADRSSQAGAFLGHGKSCPSRVGSWSGAEVSLGALRLLGCSQASGHYPFVLKPWLSCSLWLFPFPLGKAKEHEGKVEPI